MMIGSKYQENKKSLINKIRNSSIKVLEGEAKNHLCYFCGKQIFGKMNILIDYEKINERDFVQRYFLHKDCYSRYTSV